MIDVHFFASSLLKSRYVMIPALLHIEIAATQTTDCGVLKRVRLVGYEADIPVCREGRKGG